MNSCSSNIISQLVGRFWTCSIRRGISPVSYRTLPGGTLAFSSRFLLSELATWRQNCWNGRRILRNTLILKPLLLPARPPRHSGSMTVLPDTRRIAEQYYYETLRYLAQTLLYLSYTCSHEILATAILMYHFARRTKRNKRRF